MDSGDQVKHTASFTAYPRSLFVDMIQSCPVPAATPLHGLPQAQQEAVQPGPEGSLADASRQSWACMGTGNSHSGKGCWMWGWGWEQDATMPWFVDPSKHTAQLSLGQALYCF